jgi:oligopeptide transport system ATP-binding protein
MSENNVVINVSNLSVSFQETAPMFIFRNKSEVHALTDISFSVEAGQCLGIVGESGSGKTTLARALLGLVPISNGDITIQSGINRRHDIQFIFQDPLAALNPRMTLEQLITEPLDYLEETLSTELRMQKLRQIMAQVGLDSSLSQRYAHELSGGQCQRVGIARAMITEPKILICDEPVSALDVSVRAQIINLLKSLQEQSGFTMLFIAHDLSLVRYISNQLLVLYQGKLMETGNSETIFSEAQHPYTDSLIKAEPQPDPVLEKQRLNQQFPEAKSEAWADIDETSKTMNSCVYAGRCTQVQTRCYQQVPTLQNTSEAHSVACFFPLDTVTAV